MSDHASARDTGYLLRSLQVCPLRFRVTRPSAAGLDEIESAVFTFVQEHPGTTITPIWGQVAFFRSDSYDAARQVVLRLAKAGLLQPCGQVPLETVDLRYERVPVCDLCGAPSKHHRVVFWKHNTPVVRCARCRLLYANPRWKTEYLFGGYGADYWLEYGEKVRATASDPAANQLRWDPYLDMLEPSRRTGRLLDVGCATGEFLVAAKARGWEVYGVETAAQSAEAAVRASGASVHVGTLETAPYQAGMFDAITLWDVLEHVQSPRAYIAEIARLLAPNGMFALTTPNIRSLAYWFLGPRWWVVGPNSHIYYFAPRTLARLLRSSGLAIHSMQTMNMGVDTWNAWLRPDPLKRFSPLLSKAASKIGDRFLLGEELYAIARRLR